MNNALSFPATDELKHGEFGSMHVNWVRNNQLLVERVQQKPPRFFGMHGTNKAGVEGIQATKHARVEIGTFYNRNDPKVLVSNLISMCKKTLFYALEQQNAVKNPGGIFIIDVEKDGVNTTVPWEALNKNTFPMEIPLNLDAEEDLLLTCDTYVYSDDAHSIGISNHPQFNNRSQRTDVYIAPATYDDQVLGIVPYELYKSRSIESGDLGRQILATRFRAQAILEFCLDVLEEKKHQKK